MTLEQYIDNIDKRYRLGNATEHTFRGDLQQLIESLVPGIRATNEPKRQSCGAPDYILTLKEIPIGFIEAKDVGDKDLDGTKKTGNKEQFDRYKSSLNNLIFTDYINFHLYRNGEFVSKIAIGQIFPSTGGVPASGGRGGGNSTNGVPLDPGGNNSTNGVPADRGGNNSTSGVVLTTIHNTPIYRNFVENLPHNPSLNQLAKDKRKAGILSEVLFWQQVHKEKFHKLDFDRQRIIGNYIVDFYVKILGLVIEIDGSSHDNKQDYDAARQAYFESLGLKVFRCSDLDVKKNMQSVLVSLEDFIVREYGEKTTPPARGGHPSEGGEFAPIDILDYIYAVLHSPSYREKYKEFLKIDFPRVPYPKDQATFWKLVKLGGEIRQIHLLESPKVEQYITQYPVNGDNVVMKPRLDLTGFENLSGLGRVYINDTQYFDNVPLVAWEFYIGGYQPAQKWLKDRKDRTLEFEDILHYQKIIVALSETDRIMKEIDKVGVE